MEKRIKGYHNSSTKFTVPSSLVMETLPKIKAISHEDPIFIWYTCAYAAIYFRMMIESLISLNKKRMTKGYGLIAKYYF